MWARKLLCAVAWFVLVSPSAGVAQGLAAGEEESLYDPEVDGEVPGSGGAQVAEGEEQIIADPELEGVIDDPELAQEVETIDDPGTSDGDGSGVSSYGQEFEFRGLFRSRLGVDVHWGLPQEEVWEVQQLAQLEALLRTSEHTRYSLGLRFRHGAYALEAPLPDAGPWRFEYDVLPVAGYVDTSPEPGLHFRIGYQMHHLGLFDAVSALNMLSVFDMRNGPATLPEANEVAQLGLRMDWDLTTSLSLRAVYLPFFMPNLIHVTESDYAFFGPGIAQGYAGLGDPAFSRTMRAELGRTGVSAFAPDPDLGSPQGAMRLTLRGSAGELSLTGVTALERLPAFVPGPGIGDPTVEGFRLPVIEYSRLYVVGLDGSVPVGPMQVGFEAAYTFSRALVWPQGDLPSESCVAGLFCTEQADMAQLSVRAEWVRTSFVIATEAFGTVAIDSPSDASARWVGLSYRGFSPGVTSRGFAYGVLGYVTVMFGRVSAELGGIFMPGPSFYAQPRLAYDMGSSVELELGAHLMQGPTPNLELTNFTYAGLYDDIDQVFVGMRAGF